MVLTPSDAFPKRAFQRTVQDFPNRQELESQSIEYVAPLTWNFASVGDNLPAWGRAGQVRGRDRELRKFWQSETMLAGAIQSVCSRNAAFEWEIEGPDNTAKAVTDMLHMAMVGNERGWINFILALSQDLYTQDNGAFIELIRAEKDPTSPVIGIAHLDSAQCTRTGNPDIPVIYTDRKTRKHKMPWYSVIPLAELPSPIEKMNGVGFCAVSRVLRHAQILKNIAVYKNEKISGRFYKAIHFIGGVSRREIDDIMKRGEEEADNSGLTRFIMPQLVASLDPEKPVSTATIDLADLPENFNMDEEMKWYISGLALGFGVDYQDFAPLPGGSLGSANQSEVLHRKSRGKSPAIFMETIQNIFKYYGVIPQNVNFKFLEKDLVAESEKMTIRKEQSQAMAVMLRAGVITPEKARDYLVRVGYFEDEDVAGIPADYGMDILIKPDNNFSRDGSDNVASRVDRSGRPARTG